jgi:hypothetical protein
MFNMLKNKNLMKMIIPFASLVGLVASNYGYNAEVVSHNVQLILDSLFTLGVVFGIVANNDIE